MVVSASITNFTSKSGKIEFFTQKMTKNGQNMDFLSKLPERLSF